MSREGLAGAWRERLDDYAQSEMTVQDWCDFNRVSIHQYYYWRRRIATSDIETSGKPAISATRMYPWLAVDVVEPAQVLAVPGGVTVRIAGAAIELQPDFNPALLRAVVRALTAEPW
jgi:hypothetical protein